LDTTYLYVLGVIDFYSEGMPPFSVLSGEEVTVMMNVPSPGMSKESEMREIETKYIEHSNNVGNSNFSWSMDRMNFHEYVPVYSDIECSHTGFHFASNVYPMYLRFVPTVTTLGMLDTPFTFHSLSLRANTSPSATLL
jgi:hypothetical protein